MKKIMYEMFSLIMLLSIVGCGKDIPTMNEENSDINSASIDGIVEDSEGDFDEDSIAEVISDNSTETVIDDEVVGILTSSQNTVSSSTPVIEPEADPEPEPHVHQYVESITVQPTCAVAGGEDIHLRVWRCEDGGDSCYWQS